jgi:hypothetical protein
VTCVANFGQGLTWACLMNVLAYTRNSVGGWFTDVKFWGCKIYWEHPRPCPFLQGRVGVGGSAAGVCGQVWKGGHV